MNPPREPTAGATLRSLRAAVFAAVCVALSATGHGLASGATVPAWSLAAGFLTVLTVAVPLAGRPRSLGGIAALLAVGQITLHTLFGLGRHGASLPAGVGMDARMGGMAMPMSGGDTSSLVADAAHLLCGGENTVITPDQARRILTNAHLDPTLQHATNTVAMPDGGLRLPFADVPLLPSLPMLLAHLLAALAAGWLLRRGDLALFRLLALSAQGVAEAALVRGLRAALALVRTLRAGLLGTSAPGVCASLGALFAPPPARTTALHHTVVRRGPPSTVLLGA